MIVKARSQVFFSWLSLLLALVFGVSKASGALALNTNVPSSLGTDLPANIQDATEGWLRNGDADSLSRSRIHTMTGLAAAWLRGVDLSKTNSEALAEVSASSNSQLLISELQVSQLYSRVELGVLISPAVLGRVRQLCPESPVSLTRICDDEWLRASKQALRTHLFDLTETAVEFAAEVRLGDSDLGLEAANALCGLMSGDVAFYEEAYERVTASDLGTRQHSLGVMALSCAYPERSRSYLLDLVGSRISGDAMVIAALELARVYSHYGGDNLGLGTHINSAIEWATPQQAAALSVAAQILEVP